MFRIWLAITLFFTELFSNESKVHKLQFKCVEWFFQTEIQTLRCIIFIWNTDDRAAVCLSQYRFIIFPIRVCSICVWIFTYSDRCPLFISSFLIKSGRALHTRHHKIYSFISYDASKFPIQFNSKNKPKIIWNQFLVVLRLV